MSHNTRRPIKRALVALGVAGVVFAAVYGLAASLTIESKTLGAGNHSTAACQSGMLTAEYGEEYASAIPGYKVSTVTVTGLESGCWSKSYRITLVNNTNTSLGEVTGTTAASGTSFTTGAFAGNPEAKAVTGVHVVITG